MSRRVGIVISGGNNHTLNFVVADDEYVQVNRYYFIKHPIAGCDVLIMTFSIQPYNPEMMLGRPGILTVQRGVLTHPGRYLESQIVSASILGYFDNEKQWRNLEVSLKFLSETLIFRSLHSIFSMNLEVEMGIFA